uniref:Si:dkey-21h14.12 n=1 Tax=Sinocyclocheilus grahami TaxID=75366 RepID=A0A672KR37_SINGR
MVNILLLYAHFMTYPSWTDRVNVRLVNGDSRCAGRVEVLHDGQWGTVCHFSWDMTDAAVVCRELSCGEALQAPGNSYFGPGSGKIWMDGVKCKGSESTLKDCGSKGWGKHNNYCADHNRDAGVRCSSKLADGPHLCSGRLEVLYGNTWYTVCADAFDQQDAEVVCRELDCGAPVQVLGAAAFGKGDAQMWTQEIQCREDEATIRLCPTSNDIKCSQDNNVGLICSGYTDLRLANGLDICSGRVERQYFSKWGTVCDACWEMRAASILCKQLNCGIAVSVVGSDWFGEGSGEIWADVFDCDGNETKLSECSISSWSRAECSHRRDVGVICSNSSLALHDGLVRLSGERQCEGEVEVFIHQVWRRVLLDSWSLTESSVVCRQLGCGSVLNFYSSSSSSPEHSHECVTGFQCSGSEAHMGNCSSPQTLNCSSTQQLSITCLDRVNVRLVNGDSRCAGRVEVLHRGQWGTVCHFSWDMTDAAVVCRELSCGEALQAPRYSYFGPGSGKIWMDGVKCKGSESTLKDCGSKGWGKHSDICGRHNYDAGVRCSKTINYGRFTRLADGPHLCSGRLEVLYGNTWYTVCAAAFDQQDAEVVCRELDCGAPVQVLGAATFGKGDTQLWTQEIQCREDEATIRLCPTSNDIKCSQDNNVGLICSGKMSLFILSYGGRLENKQSVLPSKPLCYTDLRLANGLDICSGRVERQYFSKWGTVCDACWEMRAASILCKQLNCGIAVSVVGSDWFGEGSGEIWADVFDCDGNETKLSECSISSWSRAECSHRQDVGVICSSRGSIRLVGSGGDCAGRLEVFHSGSWGAVCDDSWDIKDAHVVCRQLQCGVALSNQQVPAWFGPGSGPIWLDEVECEGNETSLWSCSSPGWGKHDCQHKEDVGVVCSGKQYTRGNVLPCINVIPPPPQQKRLMHVANAVSILCQ